MNSGRFEPTTDDGDDWVDPDIEKRFGLPEPGAGAFVAVCALVLILLAALLLWGLT